MNISEETIDSYLRGDLSDSELQAFNEAVASDPKLSQEVDFHKDIVDSLNSFRHQQLKSRLNALEVPPAGGSGATVFLKFAASIAVVAILAGSFAYWMNLENDSKPETSSELVTITAGSTEEKILPQNNTSSATSQKNPVSQIQTNQVAVKTAKTTTLTAKKKAQTASEFEEDMFSEDNNPETMKSDVEIPSMNDGTLNTSVQSVKVTIVKEKNLGYRFFNNQLFLHGNFSNSPYEVFELNNTPDKQLYLYFENNYYELIQGKTKVTSLNAITNKATILQLTQLRER